jgi:hypothetical protein
MVDRHPIWGIENGPGPGRPATDVAPFRCYRRASQLATFPESSAATDADVSR